MSNNILVTLFIDVIFLGSVLVLFLPTTVLFLECTLALLPDNTKKQNTHNQITRPSTAVLIPAHNEKKVIGRTLRALLPQLTAHDQLVVIADNCTDNTAELARQMGVNVIERNDLIHKGKGYALDYGLRFIESNSPEVVTIVDADCIVQPDSLNQILLEVARTKRPVQALYLMEQTTKSNSKNLISVLAFKIKNLVRPSGLAKLRLPCLLTGTGMAFPWSVISQAPLATGNIVEDMQLGIDLAIAGNAPLFCTQAKVIGVLPQKEQAANSQKTRWIHGHLQTLHTQVPKLIKASIIQRRFDLLAIALDLCVPPLSLLVVMWIITLSGGLLSGILREEWIIVILSSIEGLLILISIVGAWAKFARNDISLKTLLAIPFYILWKIPIYIAFLVNPQQTWIRTERDANITQLSNSVQSPNIAFSQALSLSSKIRANKEQISFEIADGSVVFQIQSGSYFSLNEIGTRIWMLIQEPQTIADIRDTILNEYAVTPEVCLRDLLAVLEQLATKQLIEIKNESVV